MFTQLACLSSKMTLVDQIDRFMRLAFKAQAQCRATLEALAMIENPPTVFARQANIAHGPQQVNNGAAPSRARNLASAPNKLLESPHERMDGSPQATAAYDQTVEAVDAIHRPKDRRR